MSSSILLWFVQQKRLTQTGTTRRTVFPCGGIWFLRVGGRPARTQGSTKIAIFVGAPARENWIFTCGCLCRPHGKIKIEKKIKFQKKMNPAVAPPFLAAVSSSSSSAAAEDAAPAPALIVGGGGPRAARHRHPRSPPAAPPPMPLRSTRSGERGGVTPRTSTDRN